MTASWMCLPSGRYQFNGTETLAHCNCLPQLFQAIPASLPAATDPGLAALAGDANGSVATTTAQIAMSMSRPLRILAPSAWMPEVPSGNMFVLSCQLIHSCCYR
jgi:hypothetical protein